MLLAMVTLESKPERLRPRMARLRTKFEDFDLEEQPVLRALAISLAFHLFVFGTWKVGAHYGVWQRATTPAWLEKLLHLPVQLAATPKPLTTSSSREVPLTFVDVDPRVATPTPPKDAKYFSALNSRPANPDTRRDSNTPKVAGVQTRVVRTFDQPRPSPTPPQPAPTPPPKSPPVDQKPQPEELAAKPKPSLAPGDLTSAPPKEIRRPTDGTADQERQAAPAVVPEPPRTLAEARLRLGGTAGQRVKQEGGVRQFNIQSSLAVERSALGEYAAEMIAAVQQRWYDLLDEHHYSLERAGKVVLGFRLNQDGTVTELQVLDSDVGDFYTELCEKAIQDPSPFKPWPRALRLDIGATYKVVKFTFYYN